MDKYSNNLKRILIKSLSLLKANNNIIIYNLDTDLDFIKELEMFIFTISNIFNDRKMNNFIPNKYINQEINDRVEKINNKNGLHILINIYINDIVTNINKYLIKDDLNLVYLNEEYLNNLLIDFCYLIRLITEKLNILKGL